VIYPTFDRVTISAEVFHRESTSPAIVTEGLHFGSVGFIAAFVPKQKLTGDLIMPIAEYSGFYHYRVADDTFYRKTAAIDLGLYGFDYDAAPPFNLLVGHPWVAPPV
jgi:hypothetical protein